MRFALGQTLLWTPAQHWRPVALVTVVALKSRGAATLSNGWTVDEDGHNPGTMRQPGGLASEPKEPGR